MVEVEIPNHLKGRGYFFIIGIILIVLFSPTKLVAQTYDMTNGAYVVSGGIFYDSGAASSNYSNDEDYTTTFTSINNGPLKFAFTSFNVESGYDYIYIYDGPNSSYPQIAGSPFTGTQLLNQQKISSGNSLTFRFTSDGSNTSPGWAATIATLASVTPTSTCSATFEDNGGAANYSDNQFNTYTYSSNNGNNLKVVFNSFALQSGYDYLYIYDGSDLNSPRIGTYSASSPGTIYASGTSLTFAFFSDQATNVAGWNATISCETTSKTIYSYQSGGWGNTSTWTLDPSGTTWVDPVSTPTSADKVVILNGRSITANANTRQAKILQINEGGELDLQTYTGHTFNVVTGQGTMRLAATTFPSGNMSAFVSKGGGTIEYYTNGDITLSQTTYNNLIINLGNTSNTAIITSTPFTINGDLTVKNGIFRINDTGTTGLSIFINGNTTVAANGKISVSSANANHTIYFNGDFINYGDVRFCNFTTTDETTYTTPATNGTVNAIFTNDIADQTIQIKGITYFYKLTIDKGSDQTYIADFQADNSTYFKLLGTNDEDATVNPPNIVNNKALEILAGTLKLGTNIILDRLVTSTSSTDQTYYSVDQDAALWLDGANVTLVNSSNRSCIVVYGKFTITGETNYNNNGSQGIILREFASYEQQGGTVNTPIFRTSSRLELGTHRGTFKMTGGLLNISGDHSISTHPSFALPFEDNSFTMSGGEIAIAASTNGGAGSANEHSWLVNSKVGNYNVSGGTVKIYATSRNAIINGNVPFYNLELTSSSPYSISINSITDQWDGGENVVPATSAKPLIVLNNLTLSSNSTFIPNNQNVTVSSNFTISSGATYTPGTNNTTFNGNAGQVLMNTGTITSGLYNFTLSGTTNTSITADLTVRNILTIGSGTILQDMGHLISAAGNILNSGTHTSQTGGSITLTGTTTQTIGGDGNGVFDNLSLNKNSGATTLISNQTLNGALRLGGISSNLTIGTYKLSIGASGVIYDNTTGTGTTFGSSKMIITAGNRSDGGLRKLFNTTGSFIYPMGIGSSYTPATIEITSAPTTWGGIAVKPVSGKHPFATGTNVLGRFWSILSDGFSGIHAGSVNQSFQYLDADITGTEGNYLPTSYRPYSWNKGFTVDVVDATNTINFNSGSYTDGEYTAGEDLSLGAIVTFYSRADGDWDTPSTWSNIAVGGTAATIAPGINNPVVIGDGAGNNHQIYVTSTKNFSSVKIASGSSLDLRTYTGHQFGFVEPVPLTGSGTLKISSSAATASFPSGDFGEFLSSTGGIVEYYTTGSQDFTIPTRTGSIPGESLSEGFEGSTFPPAGWAVISNGDPNAWARYTTDKRSGTACASILYHNTQAHDDWLITPKLLPISGNSSISFWAKNYSATWNETFNVKLSTSGNSKTNFTVTLASGVNPPTAWTQYNYDLSAYIGQEVYIAIEITTTNRWRLMIDDFSGPPLKTNATDTYNNLVINSALGRTITFPAGNLSINGNLSVTNTGSAVLNSTTSTNLNIAKDISVTAGTLRYPNVYASNIICQGKVTVFSGANFDVGSTGGSVPNTLRINGSLLNNGTFDMNPDGTRYSDVTFTGASNQTISGTGATTDFYRLYIDKGANFNPVLEANSTNLSFAGLTQVLYINNGTFLHNRAGSVTLSTIPFNIPSTGCLSAQAGTVNIGTTDNAGDLTLAGKLEVKGGTVNIGASASDYNNDIEYAASGLPQIVVSSGTLYVNGQIRRSTSIATGALSYSQTGGDVTIGGRYRDASAATRALLEVLNPGSSFTLTGGTITLVRAGGTSFGDLYLNPESSNVIGGTTGGTIIFGNANTPAATEFKLYAGCNLANISVNATNNPGVKSYSFPISINGNLSIANGTPYFDANGLNLTISGNITNNNTTTGVNLTTGGFRPGTINQNTTFSGTTAQTITGNTTNTTTFANLIVDKSNSLSLASSDVYIYNDLTLNAGTFDNAAKNIRVNGNIYNNATHSSSGVGALVLEHISSPQNIYGNDAGTFGSVTINNSKGINLQAASTINKTLTFTSGYLFIDDNILTLGESATVSGVDATKFISVNGALSDGGVKKLLPAGNNGFLFPVGTSGAYTPANITFTGATSSGWIQVKPMDERHPGTNNPTNDQLDYYWNVTSSGLNGATASHVYTYIDSDIEGTETLYETGKFDGLNWQYNDGVVDYTNNELEFTGKSYITGEYTAGLHTNFTPDKPLLYSRGSSTWTDTGNWSITDGGSSCSCYPQGNPVIIKSGHTITMNADGAYAYSVDLQGTLDLVSTVSHYLGHVKGVGTLKIGSTSAGAFIFPGGNFDEFMATNSSTVEYSGSGSLPTIKNYQNITFSGVGSIKTMSCIDLLVRGNLNISAGFVDNTRYSKTIKLQGNWINNVTDGFIPGFGIVSFEGSKAQTINYSGTGNQKLYRLQINKSSNNVTLNAPVEVTKQIYLTNKNFVTSATNYIYISNTSTSAVTGGSSSSFIDGTMRKSIANGSYFDFPVGDGVRFGKVRVFSTLTSGTQNWESEYFNLLPTDNLNVEIPIENISNNEYWRVSALGGGTANIRLRWDGSSGMSPVVATRLRTRVAQYQAAGWTSIGNTITDISQIEGYVATSNRANTASGQYFTLGFESLPTAKITTSSDPSGFCSGGTATLDVALTGTAPWTLKYKVNKGLPTETEITINNIASSPYSLVLGYDDLFAINGASTYTVELSDVVDAVGTHGMRDFSVVRNITIKTSPQPIIVGSENVGINQLDVSYNVTAIPSSTYLWSISGLGTIDLPGNGSGITIDWGAIAGNATLSIVQSLNGCSGTSSLPITVRDWPNIIGSLEVCEGTSSTYSTKSGANFNYVWTVVGGTITSGAGTSTITVLWSSEAAGSVKVVQTDTTPNPDVVAEQEIAITISKIPISGSIYHISNAFGL